MDKNMRLDNLSDEEIIEQISERFQLLVDNLNGKRHDPYYTEKDIFDLLAKHKAMAKEMALKKDVK